VDINELRDFRSSSAEEFFQFVAGEFLAAGSFWLGIERAITVPVFYTDPLFWICVVAFLAGTVIAVFGYRQMHRRKSRIESIIGSARPDESDSST